MQPDRPRVLASDSPPTPLRPRFPGGARVSRDARSIPRTSVAWEELGH